MALDLSGARAKIERGYEHLQALNGEIESWIARNPYGLRSEVHDEGREHVGFLEIYSRPDAPIFGLLVGDAAHNFRSALDHLAFAVVAEGLAAMGLSPADLTKAEERIAFPICTTEELWNDALRRGRLKGASEPVLTEIKRRQPYRAADPAQHDLAILHALDNRDKHRLLHVAAAFPYVEVLDFIPELPGPSEGRVIPGPYEDGAEIFRVRSDEPCPDVQVKCQLLVQVRVRELPESEEVRETLPKIGQLVQRIVADVAKAA